MKSATNLILFKIVYGMSLAGVSIGYPWLGGVGLIVFLIWHAKTSVHAKADFILAGVAILLGTLVDTINIQTGVLVYHEAWPSAAIAPLWIMVLWANLALLMNGALRWLQGRYLMAAAIGALVGPLGYMLGVKLGTASYASDRLDFVLTTGVSWMIALPLLLLIAERLRQRQAP
ncbi:MAG: DUF2878 domain-containing protein [Gammaproteobacteria bacterium]|nr:DUF2878 domain-containing protein [Gammaproteobacteria bacterium]